MERTQKVPVSGDAIVNELERQKGVLPLSQEHEDKLAAMRQEGYLELDGIALDETIGKNSFILDDETLVGYATVVFTNNQLSFAPSAQLRQDGPSPPPGCLLPLPSNSGRTSCWPSMCRGSCFASNFQSTAKSSLTVNLAHSRYRRC